MKEISLTTQDIINLHNQLSKQDRTISKLRSYEGLESALNAPFQTFNGQELVPGTIDKAAHLAYGLVKNHCFIDGNKRIAMHTMLVFLALNEIKIEFTEEEVTTIGLLLAEDQIDLSTLKGYLHTKERK